MWAVSSAAILVSGRCLWRILPQNLDAICLQLKGPNAQQVLFDSQAAFDWQNLLKHNCLAQFTKLTAQPASQSGSTVAHDCGAAAVSRRCHGTCLSGSKSTQMLSACSVS